MTKPKNDAKTHHQFSGTPAVFVVRYDSDLLVSIKALADRNNESINKTINELCQQALNLTRNQDRQRKGWGAFHEKNHVEKSV